MPILRIVGFLAAGLPLAGQDYSIEKERALGKSLAADFRRSNTVIDAPAVQDYLERLGVRLAAHVPDARLPFTFSVIAEDPCRTTHEPVALPGGSVFVPLALLRSARDEAELAGMLAHAMQHIARPRLAGRAAGPLIYLGGCTEQLPAGQRKAELEADILAVRTMAHAGFDPAALARYLERLRPPGQEQRLAAMRQVIDNLPALNYAEPGAEFVKIQQALPTPAPSRAPSLKR